MLVYFKPLKVLVFVLIHYNSNRTAQTLTMALKLPRTPFLPGPGTTSKVSDIQGMGGKCVHWNLFAQFLGRAGTWLIFISPGKS